MIERIGLPCFAEWLAYARINPFGDEREDWRMGQIASTIANAAKGLSGASGGLAKPSDFMLGGDSERREPTAEELQRSVYRLRVWKQRRQQQGK